MSSIADARAAIYSRLASSPTFHPASANLFENWTLQGGDVVTVKSDNDSYNLPIYGMKVKWNGATKVTVQSTGNEQREPLEKMAAKENERNNYRNRVGTSKNLQEIHYDIFDESGHFHSTLDMTASYLRTSFEDADNGLRSELEMTASYLRTSFEDADNGLRSLVEQTASSWRASVQGVVDSNGRITAASIAIAINESGSSAYINADHVYITGTTTLSGRLDVNEGLLRVKGTLTVVAGNNSVGGMSANVVAVNPDGYLMFAAGSNSVYIYASDAQSMIKSASVSGNVLTLTPFKGSAITFSKATSLSGAWSSGVFTVKALQNNVQVNSILTSLTAGSGSWNGKTVTIPIKATIGSSATLYDTGKSVSATYPGADVESSDIQIGTYGTLSSGTAAPTMKSKILDAISNGTYFSFKVTVSGTSAAKTYYMNFA